MAATGNSFIDAVKCLADGVFPSLEESSSCFPVEETKSKQREVHGKPVGSRPRIAATYDYADEKGELLFQVVRFDPKDFRQRRPDGLGGWIWNLDGTRRVLYRLPEVISAEKIVICEGEKDVDNLRPYLASNWAATTASGGSGKWDAGYTAVLFGKDVVILPDMDSAGQIHLDLLVKELKPSTKSLRIALLDSATCRAPLKDISDYLETFSTDEKRSLAVAALLRSSISVCEDLDVAECASNPVDRIPVLPFPWDAVPPIWLNRFQDLSESLSVSTEAVISSALAILSGAIGNQLKVSPKSGWKTTVGIWMALAGDSGQGKSPIIRTLMEGLYHCQSEAFNVYETELKKWQSQAPKRGEHPDPPPKLTRYFTTDPTVEALLNLLAENPRGVLMVKDELASLVCGFNQYKPGGRGSERQHYLSIFSGSPVLPDRRHGEKVYVKQPCLALLGGIQRGLIPKVLGPEAFGDGLIYRFLFLILDKRWYPLSRRSWQAESRDMWQQMITKSMDSHDERVVLLSNDAWDSFRNYRDHLYGLMSYLPSRFAGFIPKATEYALRLAGILHVWHAFPDFPPRSILSQDVMGKAIRLASFYLGQARLLLQLYQDYPELRADQQILIGILAEADSLVDNGAVPTGILCERFNARVPEAIRLTNTRKLTANLKELSSMAETTLTFRAMRWRNIYSRCLVWEQEKIAKLLRLLPSDS